MFQFNSMPKPTSKKELLSESHVNHQKLIGLIDSLSKAEQKKEFHKGTLNRNIRDVLSHLHHWHLLTLEWHRVGMSGEKPHMPAEGYTWKTLPDLNKEIWKKYQKTSLNQAIKLFNNSHNEILALAGKYSNKELFTKKKYAWTGSTSLGAYLISSGVSHYTWAIKLIKKGLK